jgi:hypothetical protein
MESLREAQQAKRVSAVMTSARLLFVIVISCVTVLCLRSPAFADGNGRGTSDGDTATVSAGNGQTQPGTPAPVGKPTSGGGSKSSGPTTCTAQDGTHGAISSMAFAAVFGGWEPPPPPDATSPGHWYAIFCGPPDPDGNFPGHYRDNEWVPDGTPPPGGPTSGAVNPPVALSQEVKRQIRPPMPTIHMNPDPNSDQLVGLATWLWVDQNDLGTQAATVNAGPVSVTGTMSATSVTWNMGDGHTITCQGPGTPYSSGATPTCSYTYGRSSAAQPGRRYTVTATITWSGNYTVAGAPGGGALAPITRTASTTVRVAEAQALNAPS